MKHEPQLRWSDEGAEGVPKGLRDALLDARDEGPSSTQLARLIAAATAAGASLSAPPSVAAVEPSTSLALKYAASLLSVVALGAAFWALSSTRDAPAVPAPRVAALPVQSSAAPSVEPSGEPQLQPVVSPAVQRAKVALREPKPRSPRLAVAKEIEPPARQRSIADEIALLQRAKRVLPATPARALELLDTHRNDFPAGAFSEEREALAIEALFALERPAAAHSQLASFRSRHPNSAYLRRLDALSSPR